MDSLAPGTLLSRRYRLLDRIGVGGMSVIWRASDEMLERGVAVKVLAADLAADSRYRDLVRAEARAAAALVHPHVTATYDYGEAVSAEGTVTAYVVMELLEGEPLSARLTAGPLPWPEALRTCAEVADALASAHRHGIVHRDITADNVMLTPTGAKVLDFGIATTIGAQDEDADGSTFGTPAYVAPERLDGRRAKPATDTYALGVLLFEMLTGNPPYPADTWEELAATRRDDPPQPAVAGLPAEVAALCQRCLAVEPLERPTANQVAWTLRRHLPGAGERSRARRGLQRALVATGAAVSLALGALVGATLLSPAQTPVEHPDPQADAQRADASPRSEPGPAAGTPGDPGGGADPSAAAPAQDPVPNQPGADLPGVPDPDGSAGSGETPAPRSGTGSNVTSAGTLHTVYQLVEDGRDSNDIREDVALDLHQLIDNLQRDLDLGNTDLSSATTLLRDKVRTRAEEGTLGQTSAQQIDAALTELVA